MTSKIVVLRTSSSVRATSCVLCNQCCFFVRLHNIKNFNCTYSLKDFRHTPLGLIKCFEFIFLFISQKRLPFKVASPFLISAFASITIITCFSFGPVLIMTIPGGVCWTSSSVRTASCILCNQCCFFVRLHNIKNLNCAYSLKDFRHTPLGL